MKILFLCVANSIRSQMAEGLARTIFGTKAQVQSAGSGGSFVHPMAIQAMREVAIDISHHTSKGIFDIGHETFDVIVTLCEGEVCPADFSPNARRLYWPTPDPSRLSSESEDRLAGFRTVRDQLQEKIEELARELKLS